MKKIFLYNREESKDGREIYKNNDNTIIVYYDDIYKSTIMRLFMNNNKNSVYLKQDKNNIWSYKDKTVNGMIIELRATVFVKEAVELETIIYV